MSGPEIYVKVQDRPGGASKLRFPIVGCLARDKTKILTEEFDFCFAIIPHPQRERTIPCKPMMYNRRGCAVRLDEAKSSEYI